MKDYYKPYSTCHDAEVTDICVFDWYQIWQCSSCREDCSVYLDHKDMASV